MPKLYMQFKVIQDHNKKILGAIKKNKIILPSVLKQHSAKHFFAECPSQGHSAKVTAVSCRQLLSMLCRVPMFAECQAVGKSMFAECFYMPRARHSAKSFFAECFGLPCAALGKESLCRVPDILRSANYFALGKACFPRQCISSIGSASLTVRNSI